MFHVANPADFRRGSRTRAKQAAELLSVFVELFLLDPVVSGRPSDTSTLQLRLIIDLFEGLSLGPERPEQCRLDGEDDFPVLLGGRFSKNPLPGLAVVEPVLVSHDASTSTTTLQKLKKS